MQSPVVLASALFQFLVCCRGQHVALDFVRGVVHMHSRHIVHLDLKSANILLSRDGTAKIADVSASISDF